MLTRRTLAQALVPATTLALLGGACPALRANATSTVSDALAGLQPRGQSMFRWFGLDIYQATLFTTNSFDPGRFEAQRFALELEYRRAFEADAIALRSIEEMQGMVPLAPETARAWRERMARLFPDVQRGDRLLGLHEPGVGARFYANGRWLGTVDDATFAARFFGIWLSPRTSQPRLREALIAGAPR